LEEKSGKMSGINMEEYLTADDDLMVFARVTEEDILSQIADKWKMMRMIQIHSPPLLTFQEALQSVQSSPFGHFLNLFIYR
ncbi:hypothetical protein AVEN_16395-1, partial [Araneus ventricosus]